MSRRLVGRQDKPENWRSRATIDQREFKSEYSFYLLTGERLSKGWVQDIMSQYQHGATGREKFGRQCGSQEGYTGCDMSTSWERTSEFAILNHTACISQVRVLM